MLLDRKSNRSSGLPRFKPLRETASGARSPGLQSGSSDHHSNGSLDTTSKQLDQDSSYPSYTFPSITSLSAFKSWFDNHATPSPPFQTIPSAPLSALSPPPARAAFPLVSTSSHHQKSANPSHHNNNLKSQLSVQSLRTPPSTPHSKLDEVPVGGDSHPTQLASKNSSLKPSGNSFRRRTPSSLFTRRLSSTSLLKSKVVNLHEDVDQKQHQNIKRTSATRIVSPNYDTNNNNRSPKSPGHDTTSFQKSQRSIKSPQSSSSSKLPRFRNQAPNTNTNKPHRSPPVVNEDSISNLFGASSAELMNVLSLGIQYHPTPAADITRTDFAPQPPPQPAPPHNASAVKPGPRASSLNADLKRFSDTPCFSPTTLRYNLSKSKKQRSSVLTLASTCTGSDDEAGCSDLASIRLPSSPTSSFNPSTTSIDLLSDFPMPPSRGAMLSPDLDLVLASHLPSPSQLDPDRHTRLNYSPYLPPQIPLPPLPSTSKFDVNNHPNYLRSWSPLSYPDKTPTQPIVHGLGASHLSVPSPNPLDSPDASNISYGIDDLLELYQNSPAATRSFKRMDRSGPSPIKSNLSVSIHAGGAGNFNSMDSLPLSDTPNLLDVNLHSRPNTPDHIIAQEFDKQAYDNLATSNEALNLSQITHTRFSSEDDDDTTSEIDLNEPLDTMAVRLGYQLDLPDGSDSDDESHLQRHDEFGFEDELLDSVPLSSPRGLPSPRGPSRSGFLQMRSLSSLRTTFSSSKARGNRVVIAEASSSDEEEFDLKLDHQHVSRQARGEGVSDLSGEPEPKWHHSSRHQWRRSSIGSVGTIGSFATTPSSSHSSYQTNLSTPNSSQVVSFVEPINKEPRGLLGLGFDVEASGEPPKRLSRLETREYQLPGKPGSSERREWLQRAFSKREKRSAPQERSSSLPGSSKVDGDFCVPSLLSDDLVPDEARLQQSKEDDEEECLEENPLGGIETDAQDSSSSTSNRPVSRRLKPLMLVSRSHRHLSHPIITSTIAEEDAPPAVAVRSSISYNQPSRNSCAIVASGLPLSTAARSIRPRTSLVNLAYHRSSSAHHPTHLPRPSVT